MYHPPFNGYHEPGAMPPPPSAQQRPNIYQPPMHNASSGGLVQSPTNAQFYGQAMPANQTQIPQAMSAPQSSTQSMGDPSIDTKRIQLLLELNNALIQEVVQLQANGRAGPTAKAGSDAQAASPTASDTPEGESEKKLEDGAKKGPPPSREFIECMFRLRGNFAYLTNLASRNPAKQQPIIERPQILEPLSTNIEGNTISEESMSTIRDMYRRLKELFPPAGQMQQPQGQGLGPGQGQLQQQQSHPMGMSPQQQSQSQQQRRQESQIQQSQAQVQAHVMQQQILQHQQQMAAQAGVMPGVSPSGMGRGQHMTPQLMQQHMMARNMAMQNHQGAMNQGM